jgi:hypothetical protein
MLAALCLLVFVTRLWPVLLLFILGIFVCAIVLLFRSFPKNGGSEPSAPAAPIASEPPPSTERDIDALAYGILQRRISERVRERYPEAFWVWSVPDAPDRFARGLPLAIVLSRAGGHKKVVVQTLNLRFEGLVYETSDPDGSDEAIKNGKEDRVEDNDAGDPPGGAVDYGLLAFEWVEANLLNLNNRANELPAKNETKLLIEERDLPHRDSWRDICAELTRNGFLDAVTEQGGILATPPG